jgi:uncharacterized protein (TIGR02118 family)
MIKLTVLYGTPTDPAAFDTYYHATHLPLAEKIPGLRRTELARVTGTPDGSASPYHLMAELYFDDLAALQAGMGAAEGQAAAGDIPNFATGGATLVVSEVLGR